MPARCNLLRAVVLLLALGSCRSREEGVFVTAPFNEATRLAAVDAQWQVAPDGLHFEIRVENRLADRLFVRLSGFAIVDSERRTLATSAATHACVLAPHASALVLAGDVALSEADSARAAGFELQRFGVPLSDRGRGIYREFVIQQRVRTPASVDEEIAAFEAAPPCR